MFSHAWMLTDIVAQKQYLLSKDIFAISTFHTTFWIVFIYFLEGHILH